jgi:hypothetical protein
MNNSIVRCRCGHHVVGREVLRVEPYERASGEEVVYIKYRCRHCKQMGEEFIPRLEWNPSIFDAPRNEMSYDERDRFLDEGAISSGDLISFHRSLQKAQTLGDLERPERPRKIGKDAKKNGDKKSSGDKPSQTGRSGGTTP